MLSPSLVFPCDVLPIRQTVCRDNFASAARSSDLSMPIVQGLYSPTILKNDLNLGVKILLYIDGFESNATFDWLNHTV